jgi:hypothetical protein
VPFCYSGECQKLIKTNSSGCRITSGMTTEDFLRTHQALIPFFSYNISHSLILKPKLPSDLQFPDFRPLISVLCEPRWVSLRSTHLYTSLKGFEDSRVQVKGFKVFFIFQSTPWPLAPLNPDRLCPGKKVTLKEIFTSIYFPYVYCTPSTLQGT